MRDLAHSNRPAKIPGPIWLIALALLLSLWAYRPGLIGGFVFDDVPNIAANPKLAALAQASGDTNLSAAIFSSQSGPSQRPLSMLSFAVNVQVFGMNAFAFKTVNVLIHLFNGLLVFALCRRLAARWVDSREPDGPHAAAAAVTASLWLLHPMHVSDVLYIVQRMNELASLFTLCGLIWYTRERERMLQTNANPARAVLGLFGFGGLAILCKENGALIVAYALVIELTCFHTEARSAAAATALRVCWGLMLLLPALALAAYLIGQPHWAQNAYIWREFTLTERLLTEPRILWQYLLWIVIPNPAWLGLFHDDIAKSTGLLQPVSTLPALTAMVLLIICALWQRNRHPVVAFAVLWFFAGHPMESTFVPLELAFEHRNYLPMMGLVLALGVGLTRLPRPAGMLATATLVLVLSILTFQRGQDWRTPLGLALSEATHHPGSARANYEAGRELVVDGERSGHMDQAITAARPLFERAMAANTSYALGASGLLLTYMGAPRVPDGLVAELGRRLRIMRNVSAESVLSIVRAAMHGKLPLNTGQVLGLLQALLDNPSASDRTRAQALSGVGEYYFTSLGDHQNAIAYTLAAAERDPKNPQFRVDLANLALALGRPDIAADAVALAEQLDVSEAYVHNIQNIRARLEACRTIPPTCEL